MPCAKVHQHRRERQHGVRVRLAPRHARSISVRDGRIAGNLTCGTMRERGYSSRSAVVGSRRAARSAGSAAAAMPVRTRVTVTAA
jgi:hypothetical protein